MLVPVVGKKNAKEARNPIGMSPPAHLHSHAVFDLAVGVKRPLRFFTTALRQTDSPAWSFRRPLILLRSSESRVQQLPTGGDERRRLINRSTTIERQVASKAISTGAPWPTEHSHLPSSSDPSHISWANHVLSISNTSCATKDTPDSLLKCVHLSSISHLQHTFVLPVSYTHLTLPTILLV